MKQLANKLPRSPSSNSGLVRYSGTSPEKFDSLLPPPLASGSASRNRIKRYLSIYYFLARRSVIDILIFRVNALVIGLAPIFWLASMLVFIATIFSKVKSLGGWSVWEVVFLTGVHEVIFLLTWATVIPNLRSFVNDVRNGKFDQVLLKPISPRFLSSFKTIDFTVIGSVFNVIFVFFFSLSKVSINFSFPKLAGFLILLCFSYVIAYLIYFIFASLALFFINSRTLLDIVFELTDVDRYPAEIYPVVLKTFFTFFLPMLFLAYFPTAFLLGKVSAIYIIYAFLVAAVFFFISHIVWHRGLKNYQSASS